MNIEVVLFLPLKTVAAKSAGERGGGGGGEVERELKSNCHAL